MKASELRIGSYVRYSSLIQVNGYKIAECEDHPDRFTPILLTEEWLLKFGFGNITEQCASKSINIKTFCKSFTVKRCIEQQTIFIELGTRGWTFKRVGYPLYKYVHQLQNLYFALTSKELIKTD